MDTNLKRFLAEPGKQTILYIAGGAATVLMTAVILCNLLLILSNLREPDQMPSLFGVRPAIVLSGSMPPAFEAGDLILLKKTKEPDKLEVGDVACYLYSGKATTHRVIERFEAEGKPRYIMKGDYNNVEDRLAVDPEQIQGVWTGGRIRRLGKFLMFLQSTMGMFLFLIGPLAGLLAWDIVRRRRADRQRPEDGTACGHEDGQEMTGWSRVTALRGMLGYKAPEEHHQDDSVYRQEPGRVRERRSDDLEAARQPAPRRERDDEFYYYSQLDEELDYYQELEEAAKHYRRMKESLKRYRRMEAVMNRCRRLEEELSRYETLADRLEAYERQNRNPGKAKTGASNQGPRRESPVDHIERPGGMTLPAVEQSGPRERPETGGN